MRHERAMYGKKLYQAGEIRSYAGAAREDDIRPVLDKAAAGRMRELLRPLGFRREDRTMHEQKCRAFALPAGVVNGRSSRFQSQYGNQHRKSVIARKSISYTSGYCCQLSLLN
jgi:hypothetical protein